MTMCVAYLVIGLVVGVLGTSVFYSESAKRGGWIGNDGNTYTITRIR